jgi:hypothetical protein
MCSTTAARIARICGAIEELAGRLGEPDGVPATASAAAAPDRSPGTAGAEGGTAGSGQPAAGDVADRLAAIWSMIADADPELARRLPGYLAAAEHAPGWPPSAS